ncbi:MAG: tetratricopeptide repeat protein [Planctomycetes bacterium]|nr:tetratricopeptide repeat protein [Planctomycetota bacterium]
MKDPRLSDIFDAALQKSSSAERAAYLDGACGADANIRGRVETLLRAHEAAGGFLQATVEAEAVSEGPGTIIGRYKLLQQIGEGGFGVVYMAEQIEPVRRKVALKVIKLGMDTKQVVARFESERQALALMDHPNIARVFDAGSTVTGRPYFVMELVRGIAITEYADKNGLSMRERLALFVTVCQAVQHAHQKGIIHRDIKPTNVLVTLHDGIPVVKVIDFGIAKATSMRLTEKTVFTEFRQIVGTPQYMSPEQAEMSGLDVDTRCDIYSLGVLLYELLTATTPIAADWLKSAGYAEMQRIIRDEDPPPPSLRISTMHEELETVARNRKIEPRQLSGMFRGDLDWIVMKALEKDRTRRYATASDLAADIERYLRHEPVEAGPPGTLYRLRKFIRRNRSVATVALVVGVAMLVDVVFATNGYLRAHAEAQKSQAIAAFLEDIVVAVNPEETVDQKVDVPKVINRARELFGKDHATVAAALDSLGLRAQRTGDLVTAERLFRESARIWWLHGDNSPNLALTLGHLGGVLRMTGDDSEAESVLRESLTITSKLPDSRQLAFCETRSDLAAILERTGRLDEARTLLQEAVRILRLQPRQQPFLLARTLEKLSLVLTRMNSTDEAEQVMTEVVQLSLQTVPEQSQSAAYYNFALGHWLRQNGRLEKAEPYFRNAWKIYREMKDPPREYYLYTVDALFQLVVKRDDAFDEALLLFHECMHNMARLVGTDHISLGAHFVGYGTILADKNHDVEAVSLLVEGLRIYRASKGEKSAPVLSLDRLERLVRRIASRPGRPRSDYETALSGAEALCREDPESVSHRCLLGIVQYRLGKHDLALAELTRPIGSDEATTAVNRDPALQRLAYLTLAQFDSGAVADARVTLTQLRDRRETSGDKLGAETLAVIAEAEQRVAEVRNECLPGIDGSGALRTADRRKELQYHGA